MSKSLNERIQLFKELEKEIEFFKFSRIPISENKISDMENKYDLKINSELKEILTRVGCTYWGFNDMSWEWIELSNDQCRKDFQDSERKKLLKTGFVFSDDGAGNPILITEDGTLYILYHDSIEYEKIDETIASMMDQHYEYLLKLKNQKES